MLLKNGSTGKDVVQLQNDLIDLGFGYEMKRFGADGHFGDSTETAVKQAQEWLNVKVDGLAGYNTLSAIDNAKQRVGTKGTRNFSIREFRCKGTGTLLKGGMDRELMYKLERLRLHFDKPVIINSGYRSPSHNRNVGGAKNSQHIYGKAADIVVKGVSPRDVYNYAVKHFDGVGKYTNFTHTDTRGYHARW